jgi:hypothetical protein
MISRTPTFSIVMPTRNHAQLLPCALQSALQQGFDDYEIVVSDNCSTDNTEELIRSFNSSRIRYVRTERPLSMAKNFEYGLSLASGRYVTFLPDDDAFCPNLLEAAEEICAITGTDLLTWNYCYYFYEDWKDAFLRRSVMVWPFKGAASFVKAREILTTVFGGPQIACWPYLGNCLYRRQFLNDCKSKAPYLFSVQAGDMFCGALALSHLKTFVYLDRPLSVYGWRQESTTAMQTNDPENAYTSKNDEEEARELREFLCDPLKLPMIPCYTSSALLRGKAAAGDLASDIQWNPVPYFAASYSALKGRQSRGADVNNELCHFETVLQEQPISVREEVRKAIKAIEESRVSRLRKWGRSMVDRSNFAYRVEMALRPSIRDRKARWILGKHAGFNNILQCATGLDMVLAGELSRPCPLTARPEDAGLPALAGAQTN